MNPRRERKSPASMGPHACNPAALLLIDAFAAGTDPLRRGARSNSGSSRVASKAVLTPSGLSGRESDATLDSDELIHLHGYDIETPLIPGTTATMAIQARFAGWFPVTGHSTIHPRARPGAETPSRADPVLPSVLPE
jgi:hypothetical protein